MADAKISALTSLASGHATGDLLPIVDVSDTTQAASGTTKQTTLANLLANLPGPTNAVGISYTGQSLTGSNASTLLNLATTWNTSGTPTAVKVNVTDTASNAASLLQDWQVGGASQASIDKTGLLTLSGGSSVAAKIKSTAQFRTGGIMIGYNGAGGTALAVSNDTFTNVYFVAGANGAFVPGTGYYGFGASSGAAADAGFVRSAAGVIKVTNGSTGAGAMEFIEQTAPSAPSADCVRVYAKDNGSGKTQLMALFSSGAAQQIAIQP